MVKKENVKMDLFYFKKYSRYVKDGSGSISAINLFLTLKKCRKSCYIHIIDRHHKSFLRILKYYKMNYEERKDGKYISYIISKNKISEKVKNAFFFKEGRLTPQNHIDLGKFLDYPIIMDLDKIRDKQKVGSITFYFRRPIPKNTYREHIYTCRAPSSKITSEIVTKMNTRAKKYEKCIQKYLGTLYTTFYVELSISY